MKSQSPTKMKSLHVARSESGAPVALVGPTDGRSWVGLLKYLSTEDLESLDLIPKLSKRLLAAARKILNHRHKATSPTRAEAIEFARLTRILAWIPVTDSLPDDNLTVIIADTDDPIWFGYREAGAWYDVTGVPLHLTITHWMPLPEPPAPSHHSHHSHHSHE